MLEAGKGLTMLASVTKGRYQDKVSEAIAAKQVCVCRVHCLLYHVLPSIESEEICRR